MAAHDIVTEMMLDALTVWWKLVEGSESMQHGSVGLSDFGPSRGNLTVVRIPTQRHWSS